MSMSSMRGAPAFSGYTDGEADAYYGNNRIVMTPESGEVVKDLGERPMVAGSKRLWDKRDRDALEQAARLLGSPIEDGCLTTCPHHKKSGAEKAKDIIIVSCTAIVVTAITFLAGGGLFWVGSKLFGWL